MVVAQRSLGTPPSPDVGASQQALVADLPTLRAQLLRQARHAVGDPAQAEDLVQETLLAVMQQHQTRRGAATLATWAVGILRHKVADWYRSPDRRRLTQFDDDSQTLADDIDALYDSAGGFREPVPAWQQPEGHIERCLVSLPQQTRRVFMMREWLGFETGEICERLGLSADHCRTILHRARMSLRICMQRDWLGGAIEA